MTGNRETPEETRGTIDRAVTISEVAALAAAELLLAAIDGEPAHGRRARPCRLVPRDSTAVPAAARKTGGARGEG